MTKKNHSYLKTFLKLFLVAWMTVAVPSSCGGGGSDDVPQPINPQPQPQPTPQPATEQDPITGLASLNGLLQVEKEVNLLWGLTFGQGVELTKTEIVVNGQRTEIADPKHFTPDYPGNCSLIFTIKKNGTASEVKAENLTIKPLSYLAMTVTHLKPVEIMPIIRQIEAGDKKAYDHIEHLRIAEATRIREMMWQYGAGNHSAEGYQQLMNRLNTGMTMENPKGYDNFEKLGGEFCEEPSNHAHDEWNILNTLIAHANFKVCNPMNGEMDEHMEKEVNRNPNDIYIFGCSSYACVDKETYSYWNMNRVKKLCQSKNFLFFVAGSNISKKNWVLKNKIHHEDVAEDEHCLYGFPSAANWVNDAKADRHLIVTIGTNADWDIDQTDEIYESSRFPVGFNNDVLFAGRTFPRYKISTWKIAGENDKYPTSFVTYTNVAVADLCFQMFAEVKDIDELLDMIRSSTELRDHIRFDLNGDGDTDDICDGHPETQPLILMNPAGFFLKYLMPKELPSTISLSQTADLSKGYYKGIIFDIPGAEVKINGEWIRYNAENTATILAQNPFTLEWRINGDQLRKLGYKQGDSLKGKIIAIDDLWSGLNLSQEIAIQIKE